MTQFYIAKGGVVLKVSSGRSRSQRRVMAAAFFTPAWAASQKDLVGLARL